jgi:hypothetical protein
MTAHSRHTSQERDEYGLLSRSVETVDGEEKVVILGDVFDSGDVGAACSRRLIVRVRGVEGHELIRLPIAKV